MSVSRCCHYLMSIWIYIFLKILILCPGSGDGEVQADRMVRGVEHVAGRGVVTDVVVEGGKSNVIVEEDFVVVERAWRGNYCPIETHYRLIVINGGISLSDMVRDV